MTMDRGQKEYVLKLLEEEKRKIDQMIADIRSELSGDASTGKSNRGRKPSKRISETGERIREILDSATGLMTPAMIHDGLLRSTGIDVAPAQIRNVLRRYRDDFFESPAHGKWKIRGKMFGVDNRLI